MIIITGSWQLSRNRSKVKTEWERFNGTQRLKGWLHPSSHSNRAATKGEPIGIVPIRMDIRRNG
jgi:hypothetical protein